MIQPQLRGETFEGIHLDFSKQPGRCRIAEAGVGWKPRGDGDTFTVDKDQILQAHWSRASRGYELKLVTKQQHINQLDGFQLDDLDKLTTCFRRWYNVNLEQREHALRGWNWGKGEFTRNELLFTVQNRPAFEIPYTEIANTNLAGRNEVAVDFVLDGDDEKSIGSANKNKKLGHARDELVEARFYIPGAVVKRPKKEGGEDGEVASDDEGAEELNAANAWYEQLVERADIGDVAGDTIASFQELLHLTPRGRFDLDMYESSFRLRGKTYDYKIQYSNIKKVFALPKPDEVHTLVVMGLEPALRQGQTRYPFIVMQAKRDEDIELELNVTEEDIKGRYQSKIEPRYSGPLHIVLLSLLRGIAGKRIITPSKDFQSRHNQNGVKCSIKANEGHLFMLDKAFIFTPKPCTYIQMDQISLVTLSRVGGPGAAARTFDMTIHTKGGAGEHQFSNISREEQQPIEEFLDLKGIKVRNEMAENESMLKAVLKDESDSEDEVVGANRGSAEEDSEEEDEDFKADSDSEVADEFDSNVEDSGESDEEMEDADADANGEESDTEAMVERPKKKSKTG